MCHFEEVQRRIYINNLSMGTWQSKPSPKKKRVAIVGAGAAGAFRSFSELESIE